MQRLFFGSGVPDNLGTNPLTAVLIPPAIFQMTRATAKAMVRWDAAVSHWLVPSSVVVSFAKTVSMRRSHMPHLAVAHSGDVHLLSSVALRPVASLLPQTASTLGFISCRLRDKYLGLLPSDIATRTLSMSRVTPMGIDPDEFATTRPRQKLREALGIRGFAVLFLGRLVPIKGVDILLNAMRNVNGIELFIAGDGPLKATLEKHSSALNLNARFVGSVDAPCRAELLRACDALVLPSITLSNYRTEGLPLVISEAMAAGLPVVASDTGSVTELVSHEETGLLFPEGDEEALCRGVLRLRDNPDFSNRISKAARERTKKRDWKVIIDDILPLIGHFETKTE
jgi:glycosyltransferase involved in cell wall biosynthesis